MTQTIVFVVALLIQFGWIHTQPADLGSFGTQNDIQTGIVSYSFPSEVERSIPTEIFVLAFINYTHNGEQFNEEVAKYGEGSVPTIVSGQLVHISNFGDPTNHTACTANLRGRNGDELPKDVPWIALIKRGDCTFDNKVSNVIQYTPVGVIIYNSEDKKDLHKMRIDPPRRK